MSEYGGGLTMTGYRMMSSTGLLVPIGGSMISQVQLDADSPVEIRELTSDIYLRIKASRKI